METKPWKIHACHRTIVDISPGFASHRLKAGLHSIARTNWSSIVRPVNLFVLFPYRFWLVGSTSSETKLGFYFLAQKFYLFGLTPKWRQALIGVKHLRSYVNLLFVAGYLKCVFILGNQSRNTDPWERPTESLTIFGVGKSCTAYTYQRTESERNWTLSHVLRQRSVYVEILQSENTNR